MKTDMGASVILWSLKIHVLSAEAQQQNYNTLVDEREILTKLIVTHNNAQFEANDSQ